MFRFEFINFIFYEVWCKAPIGLQFTLALFDDEPDLKEVLSSFGFAQNAPARGKQFYKEIKDIYAHFEPLTATEIDQFKQWYKANNDIEKVCNNDPSIQLARYADIAEYHNDLAKKLGTFFKELYSQSLLDRAALKAKIGDINDHYITFMQINKVGKCPFCGLNDLLGKDHSKRDAYDHYLPKAIYPFNSINFKNLVPACHHCNSSYKTSIDPAYTPKDPTQAAKRRAVFYPYTTSPHALDIHIELRTSDIEKLTRTDINLTFGPAAVNEQIETWKDVYGIKERYEAKLCTESDGKAWLAQVFDEWKELGRDPKDFLESLALNTRNRPFTDCNFLKKPFLDACQAKGLFDALPPVQP